MYYGKVRIKVSNRVRVTFKASVRTSNVSMYAARVANVVFIYTAVVCLSMAVKISTLESWDSR